MSMRRTSVPDGPSAMRDEGVVPVNEAAMAAAWAERDQRYLAANRHLTAGQIAAIRHYRASEVAFIEPRRRGPAFMRATRWAPPRQGAS